MEFYMHFGAPSPPPGYQRLFKEANFYQYQGLKYLYVLSGKFSTYRFGYYLVHGPGYATYIIE